MKVVMTYGELECASIKRTAEGYLTVYGVSGEFISDISWDKLVEIVDGDLVVTKAELLEVERKFVVAELPANLEHYEAKEIEQFYVSTTPEIRARRANDDYFLTVKQGKGLARVENELPLTSDEYTALLDKAMGHVIRKTRYLIPIGAGLVAELDVFKDSLLGLLLVEVEFKGDNAKEDAERFEPLDWFGADVTYDDRYKNKNLALNGLN